MLRLPPLPYHRLRLSVSAARDVAPPLWPADALRRGLDTAARRLAGAGALPPGFLDWWDPRVAGGNRPRPFVLRAEAPPRLSPNAALWAELHLFGEGERLDSVRALVLDALAHGLAGTDHAPLRLDALSVEGADGPVWVGHGPPPRPASLADLSVPPRGAPVAVSFPSPLQLDKEPLPPPALTASLLFHRALTRLHALCRLCGVRDASRWEAPGAVREFRRLEVARPRLPGAAGRGHAPLFGLVGDYGATGETGDLGALLVAAGVMGLGRGTVMGLGRVVG